MGTTTETKSSYPFILDVFLIDFDFSLASPVACSAGVLSCVHELQWYIPPPCWFRKSWWGGVGEKFLPLPLSCYSSLNIAQ